MSNLLFSEIFVGVGYGRFTVGDIDGGDVVFVVGRHGYLAEVGYGDPSRYEKALDNESAVLNADGILADDGQPKRCHRRECKERHKYGCVDDQARVPVAYAEYEQHQRRYSRYAEQHGIIESLTVEPRASYYVL